MEKSLNGWDDADFNTLSKDQLDAIKPCPLSGDVMDTKSRSNESCYSFLPSSLCSESAPSTGVSRTSINSSSVGVLPTSGRTSQSSPSMSSTSFGIYPGGIMKSLLNLYSRYVLWRGFEGLGIFFHSAEATGKMSGWFPLKQINGPPIICPMDLWKTINNLEYEKNFVHQQLGRSLKYHEVQLQNLNVENTVLKKLVIEATLKEVVLKEKVNPLKELNAVKKEKDIEVTLAKEKKNRGIEEDIYTTRVEVASTFKWAQHDAIPNIQVTHGPLGVSKVMLSKLCDTTMNFDILNPVGPK
ncbi:hypothetical protein GOBAR_DD00815 [Gossypium barbadense]|nr:hypothetical protein GOBAR_DD00815 [Gossypium barbadense]